MSDESLDPLIALYRKSARETPSMRTDVRVLRLAERASRRRYPWPWFGAAVAAALMLWLGNQRETPTLPPAPAMGQAPAGQAPPGEGRDETRDYLLHMDIVPPSSPVALYLLTQNPPSR